MSNKHSLLFYKAFLANFRTHLAFCFLLKDQGLTKARPKTKHPVLPIEILPLQHVVV